MKIISNKECENCIYHPKSVFSVLNDDEKAFLSKHIVCYKYSKNEIIFHEGDKPTGLICLSDGKVKLFKEGVGGREQIVRMARPVGFIGYRALFAEENHRATAMAIDNSKTCHINKDAVAELISKNGQLAMHIIKAFATELGHTYTRTITLTQKHIRGRLAESIIFLKDTYGLEEDESTIKIEISREDLASLSNMTTSNAIRTLSAFVKEKVLALSKRKIKIVDLHALEKISELG